MRNNIRRFLPKMYLILAASLAVVVVNTFFGPTIAFGQYRDKPKVTTNTITNANAGFNPTVEARVVATHTIEYVEKPVTVVEYIDRVQRVPLELRDFKDLDQLKAWLKDVKTNTATIFFEQPGAAVDCDDYAIALQRRALENGYLMSFQIIEPGKYNSLFEGAKIPLNTLHAINLAIIDNNVYYVEPQTGEVVLAAQLD